MQRSVEIAKAEVPSSAVLEAQIAEATNKGDTQEVEVPSGGRVSVNGVRVHIFVCS